MVYPGQNVDPLQWLISETIMAFEESAAYNCVTFAPNTHKLRETVKRASFCAISSSLVDPATFMDSGGDTYLWDYDLPAYSGRPGKRADTSCYRLHQDRSLVQLRLRCEL